MPFVARYRKEVTGGLDDTQLRAACRAARLSARARRAPRHHPWFDPRAGQADRRAGRQDRRRRDQGGARGHLSALQAEAPHQGRDRPRARAGAAGRGHPRRPRAGAGRTGAGLSHRRGGRRQGGARRRARHPVRTVRRERRSGRQTAHLHEGTRLHARPGGRRQAGGRREILRLFRPCRALGERAEPSRAGHAARPQRGGAVARHRGRCRRRLAGEAGRADDRQCLCHRRQPAGRPLADGGGAAGPGG